MPILYPPLANSTRSRRIRFESTGREARSDPETGAMHALVQSEADELISDGWTAGKSIDAADLRKAIHAESMRRGFVMPAKSKMSDNTLRHQAETAAFRQMTKSEPPRRVEFGEVDAGRHGRLMVSHDQGADVISIHGVNAELHQLDDDLADGIRFFSSAFLDEMQDARQQAAMASMIGAFVERIINRHDFIGSAVREAKRRAA